MGLSTMKICHLSSVHPAHDVRIYLKEVQSLQKIGYDICFIGSNFFISKDVSIISDHSKQSRLYRMTFGAWRVYKKGIESKADFFHLHDPEMLPFGLLLRFKGKIVVYDAHEDVPRQILTKPWLASFLRKPVATVIEVVENIITRHLNAIIGATPLIAKRFQRKGFPQCIEVNNYPYLNEFQNSSTSWDSKERAVCYVGAISEIRGIVELVEAIGMTPGVSLHLAGEFEYCEVHQTLSKKTGWKSITEYGLASRQEVKHIFSKSVAGIVTFHPAPNHIEAQPNKLFEYMSAGIPVVASNFPLWKDIVEGNQCGICVDPLDPKQIVAAIQRLVDNVDLAQQMGRNGRDAVERKYNWEAEQQKLVALYDHLIRERNTK